jgi:UrcA family protein
MTTLFKIALTASLILGATATTASAQTRSLPVRYADLDLASPHGRALLGMRINRAGHLLCDTANESLGPEVRRAQRQCRADIKSQADHAIAQRLSVQLAVR